MLIWTFRLLPEYNCIKTTFFEDWINIEAFVTVTFSVGIRLLSAASAAVPLIQLGSATMTWPALVQMQGRVPRCWPSSCCRGFGLPWPGWTGPRGHQPCPCRRQLSGGLGHRSATRSHQPSWFWPTAFPLYRRPRQRWRDRDSRDNLRKL